MGEGREGGLLLGVTEDFALRQSFLKFINLCLGEVGVIFLSATSGDDIKHAYLRCLGLDGLLLLLTPLHLVHSGQRSHHVDVD
jgi:hypothetical protein